MIFGNIDFLRKFWYVFGVNNRIGKSLHLGSIKLTASACPKQSLSSWGNPLLFLVMDQFNSSKSERPMTPTSPSSAPFMGEFPVPAKSRLTHLPVFVLSASPAFLWVVPVFTSLFPARLDPDSCLGDNNIIVDSVGKKTVRGPRDNWESGTVLVCLKRPIHGSLVFMYIL